MRRKAKQSVDLIEAEGMIHAINHPCGGEHTLCGDAFDLGADEPGYEWKETKKKTVTCPTCADVIAMCRELKI